MSDDFRGSDWRWAFYLILEGSEASHNGDDGVRIHQVFYSGMSNCLLKENGGNGTSIESGSMHTLLQRNQFEYNGAQGRGCGIQINSDAMLTRDVRLVDNHEVSSPQAGVCAHNVAGVSIERNNVTDLVNTKSFCYDVTNTTQFSVSEDSVCFVKSQTSYYPGSTGSLPPPPEFEVFPLPGQNTTMGCEKGIVDRDICCPAKCGECGGLGCGARLSDGQCCYDKIKESGKECGKPPCLLV